MIAYIKELNFPKKEEKQYATLTHATADLADMGEKTITTQVKIDGDIVPDFSFDWEVEFQGEKYIMPLRIPQGAKGNDSLKSQIDLTFQHWAIYQLKRFNFTTIQQIAAGTYLPDEEVATVSLNLGDFCTLFGQVLEYYYGGKITLDFNDYKKNPTTGWVYDDTATVVTISHTKIWNVLAGDNGLYKLFGVRWEIAAAADNSNTVKGGERYVIRVGYPTTEVDHIFEYGFEGGLLKVERQVQSEEIRNMLKGRGGETNIPFRYFKNTDPNNKDFRPDPDWVEELANIYFPNLMPATFRSYIQGWKAAHINQTDADGKKIYAGYTPVGEANAYAPWAYRKGYTDTKFHPVEFVADEITISPTDKDKQVEILPGYSSYVKKGSSLDKYGPLPDTLDNNEDIYPTLQGTGFDIAVDVEQIESDDVEESAESDAKVRTLNKEQSAVKKVAKTERAELVIRSNDFTVKAGKTANLDEGVKNIILTKDGKKLVWRINGKWGPHVEDFQIEVENDAVIVENASLTVFDALTGQQRSASGIPAGVYYFQLKLTVHNTADEEYNVTVECPAPKLTVATIEDSKWRNTFDIWVKNIWNSQKGIAEDGSAITGETDAQYSERVWKPVLGDREGNKAKVMFTSGELAMSEDYEFTIVDYPVPDTSKTYTKDGETHTSHWRIKLTKSDAELEATGLYVPSTKKQGKAGDTFVFIGTEMTHDPYVTDAEKRLDDWKEDQLGEVKEIKPTAVVTTDRVRLNNEGKPNALINQLRIGNSLRLFDKRLFNEEGKTYETLYLQSIKYTYREPTSDDAALNPDVEIVLGNEYTTSANSVSMMQSEISALQRQVGAISNVEQIVRAVGDKLYLRKDGISDISLSPTRFFSLLTSGDFRAGLVGGAGWGFYKDENGNWVLEADRVNVRQEMQVNTLVINQAEGHGGMEIDTAAYIGGVTRVIETDAGYECHFDQKGGSVANLFHAGDVAYCNQWTPENEERKYYKRRVTAAGADFITLAKTPAEGGTTPEDWPDSGVNGTGVPAEGDNIIHFGSYTKPERQYVKVRDVVGGGYERYIENLNSVNAAGVEYYFIGKQAGKSRWFVGNKDLVPYSGKGDGSYIEYMDGKFNLNNVTLSANTKFGDKTLEEYLNEKADAAADEYKYLKEALPQDTEITGGLIMSSMLSLGYTESDGTRHTLAGMNGTYVPGLGGRTIASWWGGTMTDMFDANDKKLSPPPPNAAASLVRMNGSAYWAYGNIGFRADGSGWLGNDKTGIKFTPSGVMTFGSGIKINLADDTELGIVETLESLLNFNSGLTSLLVPCDADGTELEGGWQEAFQSDGSADGIKAKSLKAKVTFFSAEDVVALGVASGGSGGGGTGTGGIIDVIQTGQGNAVTGVSPSEDKRTLVVEKGNTFLLASAFTGENILSKLLTADGVGSGLDADLLDGVDGCMYFRDYGYTSAGGTDELWGVMGYKEYHNTLPDNSLDEYNYGGLISFGGEAFRLELYCPDAFDDSFSLHFRSGWNDNRRSWRKLLDSANYSSILGSAYVSKNGDTMSGPLSLPYVTATQTTLCANLNADLLDGHHETDFLRYRGTTSADGDSSLWSQPGIKQYNYALPDGLTDTYAYGEVVSLPGENARLDIYCSHHSSATDGLYFRSGWADDRQPWKRLASTDDNVASATKLQNVRKLWGQDFDGTSDVSGPIKIGDVTLEYDETNKCLRVTGGGICCDGDVVALGKAGTSDAQTDTPTNE